MKNIVHLCVLVLAFLLGNVTPASAGIASEAGRVGTEVVEQGIKFLIKKIGGETASELTESAAKKAVREAIQHSDDVAKIAREFGEEGLVQIAKSPFTRKITREVGEDATIAILKHGNMGREMLSRTAGELRPGVASALRSMDQSAARRITGSLRKAGEGADDAIHWIIAHPYVSGTAIIGSYCLLHPSARSIVGTILDHPIPSAIGFLLLVGIVIFLRHIYFPYLIIKLRRRFHPQSEN